MNDKLITLSEVKSITKLGRTTLFQMIKDNEIPSILIGKRRLFSYNEIQNWIKSMIDNRDIIKISNGLFKNNEE